MHIITSILDNDFYKFTMQLGVTRLFPFAKAKYAFINRGRHSFPEGFADALKDAVNNLSSLSLTKQEKQFLSDSCPYLDPVYLDFLEGYRYDPREVSISQEGDQLQVQVEGLWYRTILWEVPLMALICELYYLITGQQRIADDRVVERTVDKMRFYSDLDITVADFGTRRRFSHDVQNLVVGTLKQYGGDNFVGTSNVYLAYKHQTRPIGTHAHEWFMFHAARYGFKMANATGLENWVNVYRGDLGIALSDTYTTDVFFTQFDKMFSKLFDGVRHDSGDPLVFADKTIAHYQKFGIDPLTKTIIFSDALNVDKVARIVAYCRGKVGMSFGIGTSLTNDVGPKALNIVIKMTDACPHNESWTEVVKLSDEPGKHTGDAAMIDAAKFALQVGD